MAELVHLKAGLRRFWSFLLKLNSNRISKAYNTPGGRSVLNLNPFLPMGAICRKIHSTLHTTPIFIILSMQHSSDAS